MSARIVQRGAGPVAFLTVCNDSPFVLMLRAGTCAGAMSDDGGLQRSMSSAGRFRSWAATHPGSVRKRNEDGFVNRPDLGLWAVADGAGGHRDGGVAARMIVEALDGIPAGLGAAELLGEVRTRVLDAHARLRRQAGEVGRGAIIASTVVVLLARDAHFACLWAGDSRAYLLRGGDMRQVTHDHSVVQELMDSGALAQDKALTHPYANVITRAVGADDEALELDKITERMLPGDRFLLCSDGLFKALAEHDAAALLASDEDAPAERLVLAALARKAEDNVTAVTVEVLRELGEVEPTVQMRRL